MFIKTRWISLYCLITSLLLISPTSQSKDNQYLQIINSAHSQFKSLKNGKNADYIPELKNVNPDLFAIAIATVDGKVYSTGDINHQFTLQSVAKVFTLSLLIQEQGYEIVEQKIGVEPTGLPFNSIIAIEISKKKHIRAMNPMVNAGAITAVSLIKPQKNLNKWQTILNYYGKFAGIDLSINDRAYQSEIDTNYRNRAIINLLYSYGLLYDEPKSTLDVYTKQGAVSVNIETLALMGATLANDGINPKTNMVLVDKKKIPSILAITMMSGFYNEAGRWAVSTGLPAKSGVSGAILAIVPGKFAIAVFSPPLDEHGNSVRGLHAIKYISNKMGLSIFTIKENKNHSKDP